MLHYGSVPETSVPQNKFFKHPDRLTFEKKSSTKNAAIMLIFLIAAAFLISYHRLSIGNGQVSQTSFTASVENTNLVNKIKLKEYTSEGTTNVDDDGVKRKKMADSHEASDADDHQTVTTDDSIQTSIDDDLGIEEEDDANEYTRVLLTDGDFVKFESVVNWLNDLEIDLDNSEELWKYVPKKMIIEYDANLVHKDIGLQAFKGYVLFNLINMDANTGNYTSSLLVFMTLDGNIEKIYPTFAIEDSLHFCGLKLRDPETVLLAGNGGTSEFGHQYLLKWGSGEFKKIAGGNTANCHDMMWAYKGDATWQPGSSSEGTIEYRNASTGRKISVTKLEPYAKDVNHAQPIEKDSVVIASSRLTNAIIKANVNAGSVKWVAGGEYGSFEIHTLSGEKKEAGSNLFVGQHNAEYFGENEYMMFDNNYKTGNTSRLLIVKIDVDNLRMTELWEYINAPYPWGYTPYFGDLDRLPTGNLLGCFWPYKLSGKVYEEVDYEARAIEIVRDTKETAWRMDVYGRNSCSERICTRNNAEGWKMYSIERFYTAPLVYNVTCTPGTRHAEILFKTVNNFKQNDEFEGTYKLKDSTQKLIKEGTFMYLAHWRATTVTFHFGGGNEAGSSYVLSVKNQWGDETPHAIQC